LTTLTESVILVGVMKHIEFTSLIFKEGETFVSYCPELAVASCGDTVEEARRRLPEAVRLFLEESQRMGTLQDILREEGFVPHDPTGARWSPPPLIATEHMQLAF
jgi:predicted RNase H-like HicB family nuclease